MSIFALFLGLIPLTLGVGFLFHPRKVIQAQTRFRKRMEKFEKKLYKNYRATGLAFVLLAVIFLLTTFYPVWIFNLFLTTRIVVGLIFPHLFTPVIVQATSLVYI